jgi:hypothetical protein
MDRKTDHRRSAQPGKYFGHAAANGTENNFEGYGSSGRQQLMPRFASASLSRQVMRPSTPPGNGLSLALLANSLPFTHNHINGFGGNHGCCAVEEFRVWLDARNGALGFIVACDKRGLHSRAAGGLQRRCVPSLQCRHSRRRPRHGLHGPQAGLTLAGLPGVFQTVRARTRGQGGSASQHQAGGFAKACQRETVSIKTTCPSWSDLTVLIPARQNIALSPICSLSVATARTGMM